MSIWRNWRGSDTELDMSKPIDYLKKIYSDISVVEALFDQIQLAKTPGSSPTIPQYDKLKPCDCGAVKTNNPNCHSHWCSSANNP